MELNQYREEKPRYAKRILWTLVNKTIFRLFFHVKMYWFKNYLLRLFGADIPNHVNVYNTANIFAPWNLKVEPYSTIGPNVTIYNKDKVIIESNVVISQDSMICTASHDISDPLLPLKTSPIIIKKNVWVAADAFIGMGVTIGEGAVVGARAAVFKDVEPWTVVGGNPARFIKKRELKEQ